MEEEDVYTKIARKIIAIPDNKPEHAADHKLMRTAEIIEHAMRMAERHAISPPSEDSEQKEPARLKITKSIVKNFDDGTFEITHLEINGEKWVKAVEQDSRQGSKLSKNVLNQLKH